MRHYFTDGLTKASGEDVTYIIPLTWDTNMEILCGYL